MRDGVSLYFRHKTRSPNNVLVAWHFMPTVPRVGDRVTGPFGDWRVTDVQWKAGSDDSCPFACIDIHVEDIACPDPDGHRREHAGHEVTIRARAEGRALVEVEGQCPYCSGRI